MSAPYCARPVTLSTPSGRMGRVPITLKPLVAPFVSGLVVTVIDLPPEEFEFSFKLCYPTLTLPLGRARVGLVILSLQSIVLDHNCKWNVGAFYHYCTTFRLGFAISELL